MAENTEEEGCGGVFLGIVIFVILIIISFTDITVRLNGEDVSSKQIVESPELIGQDELESIFARDLYRSFVNTTFINPRIYALHTITLFSKNLGNEMKIRIIGTRYPKPFDSGIGWFSGIIIGWILLLMILLGVTGGGD